MKMAFFVGIFVAAPYILWQVWAFISPGLYTHEKVYAVPFIFFGSLFFVGGAAFGHYFLFPMTFRFLGGFGGAGHEVHAQGSTSTTRFYSWFLLGLGLVFQIPVVIFVLARIGLVTPGFLLREFKCAVLGSFVVAAFITPTPDVVTADGARPAHDRALLPGGGCRLALRPRPHEARGRRRQRGSEKLSEAPTAAFSRRAWPAFSSTT